jgi:hypothetical protein
MTLNIGISSEESKPQKILTLKDIKANNIHINAALRHVCITIVAMEKQ